MVTQNDRSDIWFIHPDINAFKRRLMIRGDQASWLLIYFDSVPDIKSMNRITSCDPYIRNHTYCSSWLRLCEKSKPKQPVVNRYSSTHYNAVIRAREKLT